MFLLEEVLKNLHKLMDMVVLLLSKLFYNFNIHRFRTFIKFFSHELTHQNFINQEAFILKINQ